MNNLKTKTIRNFILEHVAKNPANIADITAQKFNIKRKTVVDYYLKKLVKNNQLEISGTKQNRQYFLKKILIEKSIELSITNGLEEDVVWRREFASLVSELPSNIVDIWHYGFTEILNNAIDHSGGKRVLITFKQTTDSTEISILDDGKGIFNKIKQEYNLEDETHAILELAKGKLTTDPENHAGEGIFFTSRMFDDFKVLSSGMFFSHNHHDEIVEDDKVKNGTMVFMKLSNNTTKIVKEIFDQFASEAEDYKFTKTIIPVRLARYGNEQLVSRSQAKRLMLRVDCFKVVLLDFNEIDTIGQAFADEVFRVFVQHNDNVKVVHTNANKQVVQMIKHVLG